MCSDPQILITPIVAKIGAVTESSRRLRRVSIYRVIPDQVLGRWMWLVDLGWCRDVIRRKSTGLPLSRE